MPRKELVYLISPVRQVTAEQSAIITNHTSALEREGTRTFNPVRDAPQDDRTGLGIVMAELNFMLEASRTCGCVDILWNAGGIPSEGSRVDLGIAIALGLQFDLITIFNEDDASGPQLGLQIIKDYISEDDEPKPLLAIIQASLAELKSRGEVTIDWNVIMETETDEWQRLYLGLALGCLVLYPEFKINLGTVTGEDDPNKKSYLKVITKLSQLST